MEDSNTELLVLVTGGSGFVGGHCILQLLERGYKVRTTIRSIDKKKKVIEMLKNGGIISTLNLEFIEADLKSDKNWDEAMTGCDFVLHVASPIKLLMPKNENELIEPAIQGTLRVLNAAQKAKIKRVVMTSNFGAVSFSSKDDSQVINEKNWTDPNEKGLSTYIKSKILAEKAAWNFMKYGVENLELTVINPVAVFGPSLSDSLSSGLVLLKNLLDGTMKFLPNLELAIVDVRDLADLHIRAMESDLATGQRFLALSGGTMSLREIAQMFKFKLPHLSKKISTLSMPFYFLKILALFDPRARILAPLIGINKNASNEKARSILEWNPRSNEEALMASAESLLKYEVVKP